MKLRFISHPRVLLSGIIIFHIFLLFQTVFWPAQEFRVFPYLTSKGLLPYKQIIDQHLPGLFFLPLNLYTFGLATPTGIRIIQILLVLSTHVLIYAVMRKLYGLKYQILTANLLFLLVQITYEGYVLWIDSFLPPLFLLSCFLMLDKSPTNKPVRYLLSGIVLSLAFFFKQQAAVIFFTVLLYLFFLKLKSKNYLMFILGFFLPVILLFLYLYSLQVWDDFFYWTFQFNQAVYPLYAFRLPSFREIIYISALLIPVIIAVLYIVHSKKTKVFILFPYILTLPLFIYGRYDFVHIQPLLPFAVIVITSMLLLSRKRYLYTTLILMVFSFLCIIQIRNLGRYDTFIDSNYDDVKNKIIELHKSENTIYIYDAYPELYQMTGIIPANTLFVYNMPWYMTVMESRLLTSIKNSKPDIIVRSANGEKNSTIANYLSANYSKLVQMKDVVFMKRLK